MKAYDRSLNVYEAASARFDFIFRAYEVVVVSFSGGKDSTICAYLAAEAAKRHNRDFYLFYLDQEIEYSSTIDFVDYMMKQPFVRPLWVQVPVLLTNTASMAQNVIDPWNPEKKHLWVHPQKIKSIKTIDWEVSVPYTFPKEKMYGFYGIVQCMEQMFKGKKVAQIIGLRADESLDRFRATTKNAAIDGIPWSTKGKYQTKFYPIYDWLDTDVWKYIGSNGLKYNRMYDYFYLKGYGFKEMRLSNLLHEKAYECLSDLQEFEPHLYDRMLNRVQGIATAQEYAGRGGAIFKHKGVLPKGFNTWIEYRNYLLDSLPNQEHAEVFRRRFAKMFDNEYVIKQQVDRILIYDINGFKKMNNSEHDPSEAVRAKWMELL